MGTKAKVVWIRLWIFSASWLSLLLSQDTLIMIVVGSLDSFGSQPLGTWFS